MKLSRRSRLILLCLWDLARARRDAAQAWRGVRRVSYRPAGMMAIRLRRALMALARAEELLCQSFECCVSRE